MVNVSSQGGDTGEHGVQPKLVGLCTFGTWSPSGFKGWCGGQCSSKKLLDYVNGFRHRLYVAGELARKNLATAQEKK